MKKGFTLVELLAVIIILGIILIIAVPNILGIINDSRINSVVKSKDMFINSTRSYISSNSDILPSELGSFITITLSDLQDLGYIDEIKSPYKEGNCTGYITVLNTGEGTFSYNPNIDCLNDSESPGDDGLVLHYTFDDFQEPTVNLVSNANIFSSGWTSYVNGNDGAFMTEFGFEGLDIINRQSWTGAYRSIILPEPGTYSLSTYVKPISRTSPSISVRLYTSGGGLSDQSTLASFASDKIGTWQKIEMTRTYTTSSFHLYLICYGGTNAPGYEVSAQYTMPQVEKKNYATPFVDGEREGVVSDISGNGNYADLDLETTPRWIDGHYYFDKDFKYIEVENTNFNITNEATYSAWVKTSSTGTVANSNTIVARINNASPHQGFALTVGRNTSGKLSYYSGAWRNSVASVNDGKWNHVLVTHKNSEVIMYINGEVDSVHSSSSPTSSSESFYVGRERPGANRFFDGSIDNVRIYNRALSGNEIRQIYLSEKSKVN